MRKRGADMKKLIFIEGVSGVGKSTTTQNLCVKLRGMEFSVDRYCEGDFPNPIDFYATAYFKENEYATILERFSEFSEDIQANTVVANDIRLVRYYNQKTPLFTKPLLDELSKHEFCWNPCNLIPISEYTRVYKTIWEQFSEKSNNQLDYLIFDGSLFHHPINDMTRNYNASHEQIYNHITTLHKAVDSLHPQVIYLSSDDVSKRLKKARISRNQEPPSNEQIFFWEERKQKDLSVMRQLSIPYDIYDISQENWDSTIDVMVKSIIESPEERRARIYPVILSEYNSRLSPQLCWGNQKSSSDAHDINVVFFTSA